MDKSAIRNFAIEARKILMKSAITEAGFYGITKEGCKSPIQKGQDFEVYETLAGTENRIFGSDIKRRANLVHAIEEQGFDQVIEETAYTWFNRIIAIRFMEVNDYLPTRVRVLSSETVSNTPDIVTQSLDVDLNMTPEELEKVQLAKDNNKYDEAFRLLFIKQCNELNNILPGLFEKTDDYMELLLKLSYTGDGVVRMLVDTVPEDNFNVETEGQVEIIGWMYQYYNTELKDDTFAKLKKNVKISKERIPAATQLFTPDWIVRYMVENSIGKLWIEHLKANDASLVEKSIANSFGWNYYMEESKSNLGFNNLLSVKSNDYKGLVLQEIDCIDPCMGSGHILVYMFEVLMQIYVSEGFSERDAAIQIIENNISGLDIDKRAYQLSYFALMMKARQYNRRLFRYTDSDKVLNPKIMEIVESNDIPMNHLKYFGNSLDKEECSQIYTQICEVIELMKDAKEYGSLISIPTLDWDKLDAFAQSYYIEDQMSFETIGIDDTRDKLIKLINTAEIMGKKYFVLVTNPPYMGNKGMSTKLATYIQKRFPLAKTDVFACFIEHAFDMIKLGGFNSQVTMQVWMFLTAFTKFREKLFRENHIMTLLHMDNMVMGIAFGTSATVFRKGTFEEYVARYSYASMSDINENGIPNEFPIQNDRLKEASIQEFLKLPRYSVAYWVSPQNADAYIKFKSLDYYADAKKGMSTADDNTFIRMWHEVDKHKLQGYTEFQNAKWFYLNKGGSFRRWYGNNTFVVDWENDGARLKTFPKSVIRNESYYFKDKGLTWTYVTNYKLNVRYYENAAFAAVGPGIFSNSSISNEYLLGLLNSVVAQAYADNVGGETITYEVGEVATIPVARLDHDLEEEVIQLVKENIFLAQNDWNSKEISWDFKCNPLLTEYENSLEIAYMKYEKKCTENLQKMKKNEELLNSIFINAYGLSDELKKDVDMKDIVLTQPDRKIIIKEFVSYVVGCMFGRYSIDSPGLKYAGGRFDDTVYESYHPDSDGIIPIMDEAYFNDDIVGQFEKIVKVVFGEATLEDNLAFIGDSLVSKGNTSREKIRNYFLSDFYNDHCNMYSVTGSGKRPIYWLFDSGKENGFKALVYLHRYNKDTVGLIRSDYLHKSQEAIERALQNADFVIKSSNVATDKARAIKARDKYIKQLSETRTYYQALSHIALQRIELDLDDGVKVNYAKFQGVEVSNEGTKKQTIDLLAKI